VTLEGPRILEQMFNTLRATAIPEPPYMDITDGGNWDIVSADGTTTVFSCSKYYDLSGYNRDSLTTFFQGTDIQEAYSIGGTCDAAIIIDLITSELPTNAELLTVANSPPGYPASTTAMQQVVYGRQRQYVQNNTVVGFLTLTGVGSWGSMAAGTMDKVHLTRVVITSSQPGQTVNCPPANYVEAIIVAQEKELPFLMRQKRSYELATGP
jgi:hypothetical protein